jgi:alkyl hydroperoxide reductase subunit AhpC
LLADPGGEVAKKYGVLHEKGFAMRVTFIIDKDGVVQKVVEGKDAFDPSAALSACPLRKKT